MLRAGINKALWCAPLADDCSHSAYRVRFHTESLFRRSPSYLFFMAGVGGYLLILFYAIFDLQLGEDPDSPPVWQRGLRICFQPGACAGPAQAATFASMSCLDQPRLRVLQRGGLA